MIAVLLALPILGAPPAAAQLAPPWREVAPGVQAAPAHELGGDPAWAAKVILIDPQKATVAVRYDAEKPRLGEWRDRFPGALAISNGSFYSADGPPGQVVRPTCDLVAQGKPVKGAGCHRQDALFFGAKPRAAAPVSKEAAPVRMIPAADFKADQWDEAFKSFPALVRSGTAACKGEHYCAESSRTAALALLKDGKILLFASQWPAVRNEVGKWLAETMGALDALNLDGGPEATLALRGEAVDEVVGTPGLGLPMVLIVLPR
jgi:hypothetical protein